MPTASLSGACPWPLVPVALVPVPVAPLVCQPLPRAFFKKNPSLASAPVRCRRLPHARPTRQAPPRAKTLNRLSRSTSTCRHRWHPCLVCPVPRSSRSHRHRHLRLTGTVPRRLQATPPPPPSTQHPTGAAPPPPPHTAYHLTPDWCAAPPTTATHRHHTPPPHTTTPRLTCGAPRPPGRLV